MSGIAAPVPSGPAPQAAAPRPVWVVYAMLAGLLGGVFVMGLAGLGVARFVFVAGCGAVSVAAWKRGPSKHFEVAIILFAFAPFLRRVVDVSAGYEPSGLMLVGPMLAIVIPTVELRALLRPENPFDRALLPFLLMLATVVYAALLSMIQGDYMNAASGALKWSAPVLYGMWMSERAREDDALVQTAARTFLIVTPILGVYGVYQYIDPPTWDRYWMIFSQMTSIGQPEAYQIRVFSMMNSPASFATYAACGLLLFGFCRSGWQSTLLALPSSLGLLLSMYRTAWIAFAVGMLFCLLFPATRGRSVLIGLCIVGAVTVATIATPFGDVISDRLATFQQGSEDGSGQERIGEYITLYNDSDRNLWGSGFGGVDAGVPGAMPIDGMIVACWLFQGIVVGLVCLAAIVWTALQALLQVWRNPDPIRVVLGAIIVGALVQLPLAGVATGELGVLFWVFAAIATSSRRAPAAAAAPPPRVRPAFAPPAFAQPAFAQPAFAQPAFAQPAFAQPAFAQPAFAQPAFAQPTAVLAGAHNPRSFRPIGRAAP